MLTPNLRKPAAFVAIAASGVLPLGAFKALLFVPGLLLLLPLERTVVPRNRVALLLFSIFGAAFLLAPYWALKERPLPAPVMALAIAAIGLVWALGVSGEIHFSPRLDAIGGMVLTTALTLLFLPALRADLPWLGDESYHFGSIVLLCEESAFWMWALGFTIVVLWFADVRTSGRLLLAATSISVTLLYGSLHHLSQRGAMTRYPFFSRWLEALPIRAMDAPYFRDEASLRLLPFLSGIGIAWLVLHNLTSGSRLARLAFAFAVATTPLLVFFSTQLYLEMPAVLLMTFACLDARGLLEEGPAELVKRPAWVALLVAGFVKETTLPFVLAFACSRFAVRVFRTRAIGSVLTEATVSFAVLVPLIVYLTLIHLGSVYREHGLSFSNLLMFGVYPRIAASWLEQFGLLIPLFLAGSILSIVRKETPFLWFWTTIIFVCGFHITDAPEYVGLARFNLFLVPVFVASATHFFETVILPRPRSSTAILGVFALSNMLLFPLHLDGSRPLAWGARVMAIGENGWHAYADDQTYPYEDAISWIAERFPGQGVVFTGMTYDYYLEFYANRMNARIYRAPIDWGDPNRADTIRRKVSELQDRKVSIVVLHALPGESPPAIDGFEVIRTFRTATNTLVVYQAKTLLLP